MACRSAVSIVVASLFAAAIGIGTGCSDDGMSSDAAVGDTGATMDAPLDAPADAPLDVASDRDTGLSEDADVEGLIRFSVVTFNTGTTEGLRHDDPPEDGYGYDDAAISDMHYGDGLSWIPAVEAATRFFSETSPDIVAFQEIFFSEECATIPSEFHPGFVCESWSEGDPTVANVILGAGYQVACHLDKSDKCLAVKRSFGTFRGCDGDLCLDHLDGARVMDCGGGSRVGRGIVDLSAGGELTVVNVHGSSGVSLEDQDCRVRQFDQVFVDLGTGDGAPAANGAANIVLGDLNTDPVRLAEGDASSARFSEFVGPGLPFHYISEAGRRAPPTYTIFNIDHVVSDTFDGRCEVPGVTEGIPEILDAVYFDHKPIVCQLWGVLPD